VNNSIDVRITIAINPVRRNALLSVRDNLDLDLNMTDKNDLHLEKHPSPRILIDAGIIISTNPVSWKISFRIRGNLRLNSKGTEEARYIQKKPVTL
jgi:hypothetical protein